MRKQKGFTVVEMIAMLWVIIVIVGAGVGLFVIGHFLHKFW